MPGKKDKSKRNSSRRGIEHVPQNREVIYKTIDQDYAEIIKSLGDCRFTCKSKTTNNEVMGHIRGSIKNRIWINPGDTVLISKRSFQEGKVEIIHKYNEYDVKELYEMGEFITYHKEESEDELNIEFI